MRYCPMCNQRTGEQVELHEPFYIVTCQECGHIHRVSELFQMPPVMLPLPTDKLSRKAS